MRDERKNAAFLVMKQDTLTQQHGQDALLLQREKTGEAGSSAFDFIAQMLRNGCNNDP